EDVDPIGWTQDSASGTAGGFLTGQGFVYGSDTRNGSGTSYHDIGARLLDLNGDGLPDKIDYFTNQNADIHSYITSGIYYNNKGNSFNGVYDKNVGFSLLPGRANVSDGYPNGDLLELGTRYFDVN